MKKTIFEKRLPPDSAGFDIVNFARNFAIAAHGEQQYGDKPYVYHLDAVAKYCDLNFSVVPNKDGEKNELLLPVLSYLHDIYEDTAMPQGAIKSLFGDDIESDIWVLTRPVGEPYFEYIQRICRAGSPQAIQVKYADLTCNLEWISDSDHGVSLKKRYKKALGILENCKQKG